MKRRRKANDDLQYCSPDVIREIAENGTTSAIATFGWRAATVALARQSSPKMTN